MPELSPAKLAEWKARLEHAHRYWKENGLSGEPSNDPLQPNAFQFIEWYRGKQWSRMGWGGFAPEDLITVNVTFSNTNQMVSRLSKRNPEVVVTPKRKGSEESRRARVNQLVMNYFQKELKLKREVDRALLDALLSPFGLVQHIFTPHIEKFDDKGNELETYSMARADLPGIKRRPFWDVRMDPLADSWHPDGSNTWVAFRDLLSMEQVGKHPRLTKRRDLTPTKSIDLIEMNQRQQKLTAVSNEWYQLVEVWWVYDKITRTFFALSPGSEKPLMEPEEWPIPWESLPYSFLAFNPQIDSNVPIPFPHAYKDQQMELNKARTLMSELVKRLRRLIMAQRNAFSDADRARIESGDMGLQEVFFVDGTLGDVLKEIGIGGFDQTLLLHVASIKEDIREQIGMSQMDRGQRINVESSAEAQSVQLGSDIMAGRNEQTFEDFWTDTMRTFHQSLRYTMPDEILVPVVGLSDREALSTKEDFIDVSRADVDGEFHIDIRVGSTLPKDHNQEFAKAIQLKTLTTGDATVDQIELTRVLFEEAGFDSARLVRSPEQVAATEDVLTQRGQGGGPGSKPGSQGGDGLDANFIRQAIPAAAVQ